MHTFALRVVYGNADETTPATTLALSDDRNELELLKLDIHHVDPKALAWIEWVSLLDLSDEF
jgi:hypothetical protein